MKFGYQTISWGGIVGHYAGVTSVRNAYYLSNAPLEHALGEISKAGYSGFETFDGNVEPYFRKRKEFQEAITQFNLEMISVYSGASFIHTDRFTDELAKISEVAEFASSVGSKCLVVGGGEIRQGGILDEDYESLAHSLEKVGRVCNDIGISACYHPHLGTIVQTRDQLTKLFNLVDPDLVSFCPDTAHLAAGGADPVEVIDAYKDRIGLVHFKDFANGKFLPLGDGELNFPEMVRTLKSCGYKGWIVVELDYTSDTPLQSAIKSKRYIDSSLALVL
jgi:inosose dehydratase